MLDGTENSILCFDKQESESLMDPEVLDCEEASKSQERATVGSRE